jgi:cytochrome b involved in lipid metabolism
MRLKVALWFGLLMTVVPISMQSSSALVPRAGATCTKLGLTVDYQGKRFTCVKSGAKKVWNSGVTIKKTPTPTPKASASQSPTSTPSPSASMSSSIREFTLAQVGIHNSASSCWSVINGDVYDLTTWIGQHPGGASAIQKICGIDGTNSFNAQHEGSGKVARQLSQFYIGRLKQ